MAIFVEFPNWGKNILDGYDKHIIFYPNFYFITEKKCNFAAEIIIKPYGNTDKPQL